MRVGDEWTSGLVSWAVIVFFKVGVKISYFATLLAVRRISASLESVAAAEQKSFCSLFSDSEIKGCGSGSESWTN